MVGSFIDMSLCVFLYERVYCIYYNKCFFSIYRVWSPHPQTLRGLYTV